MSHMFNKCNNSHNMQQIKIGNNNGNIINHNSKDKNDTNEANHTDNHQNEKNDKKQDLPLNNDKSINNNINVTKINEESKITIKKEQNNTNHTFTNKLKSQKK